MDVLIIAPHLPAHHNPLLPLIAELIAVVAEVRPDVARAAFLESPVSPAQVLGSGLVAFSKIATALSGRDEKIGKPLSGSVLAMIEGFSWHRSVMHGIASLQLTVAAADDSVETRQRIYDALLPNLLSEDSLLRLSSLKIAASIFPSATAPVAADLIAKCIEVEEMPLSVQGAREKSMKLRKLGIVANGQLGRDGEDTVQILGIILRYLTGLSPSEARTPLIVCSDAQGQLQAALARGDPSLVAAVGTVRRRRLADLLSTGHHRRHARLGSVRLAQAGVGRGKQHQGRRRGV